MREIVIDTETTGLDPTEGHRVVEIGAVELVNHSPTGRTFHRYLCPERSNAGFDIAFLNAELKGAWLTPWCWRGASTPGHNTLDDLCSRYGVNSLRSKHGALLDAELLAAVYVELTTTRQAALQLEPIIPDTSTIHTIVRARAAPLPPRVTADDRTAHRAFVQTLGVDAIWRDYFFRGLLNSTTQMPQTARMPATTATK